MTTPKSKTRITYALLFIIFTGFLAGCSAQADTVNENLTKEADSFNIERKIDLINGITDKVYLTIEGKCSIKDADGQLEIICKVGPGENGNGAFVKHFFRLSDNSLYVAEQTMSSNVDPFHYTFLLRPELLIPNVDLQTSGG